MPATTNQPIGEESDGLTQELWRFCPRDQIILNPTNGYCIRDDFTNAPLFATAAGQSGWITLQDTDATVQGIERLGGWLRLSTSATDNDEAAVQAGAGVGAAFSFSTSSPKRLWFECKFRLSTVAETMLAIGLSLKNTQVNDGIMVDNTGALASTDFVGFHVPAHASAAVVSAVYRKTGQTAVTMDSSSLTATADADVYAGYYFDGKYLEIYVNRTRVEKYDLSTASNVPTALLSPIIAIKAGEAVDKIVDIDWIEVFQER